MRRGDKSIERDEVRGRVGVGFAVSVEAEADDADDEEDVEEDATDGETRRDTD